MSGPSFEQALKAFHSHDLITVPRGDGNHDALCPFSDEETHGAGNLIIYAPNGKYRRCSIKCFDPGCAGRETTAYFEKLGLLPNGEKSETNETTDDAVSEDTVPENVLARFNEIYAVCMHGTSAAVVTLDREGEYVFYQEKNLEKLHRGELAAVPDGDKVKFVPAFPWWTRQKDRRQHGHVVFEPDSSIYRPGFPEKLRTSSLNLWRGLRIEPKPGDHDLITEHINDVLADRNEARYEYIINWLAAKFQTPGKKVRTCLVFQGSQGDGKNSFWELAIAPLLGNGARLITNSQHVTGRFNAALRGTVLVLLNEAFWGGGRDYEGILKSLITDPVFMLEQKGIDPVEIPNYLDLIMFTNAEWPVRVNPGDRRFFITETSSSHRGDAAYFTQFYTQVTDETRAAFLHMLLSRDLSNFHPEDFPDEHDLKLNAKICSLEPHERFITEFVKDMVFGPKVGEDGEESLLICSTPGEDLARDSTTWEQKGIDLDKGGLYGYYLDYIKARSLGRAVANEVFYRSLWKMLGTAAKNKRSRAAELQRVVAFDTRFVCQKALEHYLATGRADL